MNLYGILNGILSLFYIKIYMNQIYIILHLILQGDAIKIKYNYRFNVKYLSLDYLYLHFATQIVITSKICTNGQHSSQYVISTILTFLTYQILLSFTVADQAFSFTFHKAMLGQSEKRIELAIALYTPEPSKGELTSFGLTEADY